MTTAREPDEHVDLRLCGDNGIEAGREAIPGAYAFFAKYLLLPWESVLDVGGGLGVGLSILKCKTRRARAIDRDTRLVQFGVEPGRIEDEATSSYDWVTSVDVIEHLQDDKTFLSELMRVARVGVFLTTPNVLHHPDRQWPYHIREYSPIQFRELFTIHASPGRIYQLGGNEHCGKFSRRHLDKLWEHQAIVCFKRGGHVRISLLAFRDWSLWLLGR